MAPTAAMCSAQLRALAARVPLTERPASPLDARSALVRATKSPSAPGSLTAPAGDDRAASVPATTMVAMSPPIAFRYRIAASPSPPASPFGDVERSSHRRSRGGLGGRVNPFLFLGSGMAP